MTGLITCGSLKQTLQNRIACGYTYAPIVHGRDCLVDVFVRVKGAELLDRKVATPLHLNQTRYELPKSQSCFGDHENKRIPHK